jgi:hypothetical protein
MDKKNRATTASHLASHGAHHNSSKVAWIWLFLLVLNARELSGGVKSSSSPAKRARAAEAKGSMLDPRERGNLCFKKGKFAASVDYYTEVCAVLIVFFRCYSCADACFGVMERDVSVG